MRILSMDAIEYCSRFYANLWEIPKPCQHCILPPDTANTSAFIPEQSLDRKIDPVPTAIPVTDNR